MNADLPTELRDTLQPWTQQLPPGTDDPAYLTHCQRLETDGLHPAVAAVQAHDDITWHNTHPRNHRRGTLTAGAA